MALLDEVRFSLTRLEAPENTSLELEFQRYIDEAILNLVSTTDIRPFTAADADALQKGAVIAYAHYRYELDVSRKQEYKRVFDNLKEQMNLSSKYSTLGKADT